MKQNAKKIAEKGMDTGTNIVCRFFFYVILVFKVVEGAVERVVCLRRRGNPGAIRLGLTRHLTLT